MTETNTATENTSIPTSEREWRKKLTPMQYYVAREAGTERPFSGEYWNEKDPGTYMCIGCGAPLFHSDEKFDSSSGWPSFYDKVEGAPVEEHTDHSLGMVRTEVTCGNCQCHLGHVFPDGPRPTGLRYCINSASVDLKRD
ncbi:MAG: peptide-methionine (R)-S-oxide reductase MsrB [bacterium]|nr:peptide-methionine (R)-S-oxide reductase MsrB [bacterium]MDE0290834.1 peptide-methionine (R)-S-oxide reductase MsrB [bacterium]MDE0438248.1 peptide-methionine (R)-S-oxide reductase MsrB [bacterium]